MNRITIVTPLNPVNKFNGASTRIRQVAKDLATLGVRIQIIYTVQDSLSRHDQARLTFHKGVDGYAENSKFLPSDIKLSSLSGVSKLADAYPRDISRKIEWEITNFKPDAVIVNYIFLSDLFLSSSMQDVFKIIDTHDKLSRAEIYRAAGQQPGFFCTTTEEEAKAVKRADCVLSIKGKETAYFSSLGAARSMTLGYAPKSNALKLKPTPSKMRLGFLGSGHVFDLESIKLILNERRFKLESAVHEWIFAGNICRKPEIQKLSSTKLGSVDDIEDFYHSVDIVVNPVFYGTGLKIKTIDALAHGMPLVTTDVGISGIRSNSEYHNCKSPSDLTKLINQIIENPSVINSLHNLSKSIYSDYRTDYKKSLRSLLELINPRSDVYPSEPILPQEKILHCINFTEASQESDLYIAQKYAFRSVINSKCLADHDNKASNIELDISVVQKEQPAIAGLDHFAIRRIHHDISGVLPNISAKLPFISDVIKPESAEDNDIIIYSNADIILAPHFYSYVSYLMSDKHDALIINRRTVSDGFIEGDDLALVFAEPGADHPGFDCFVFRASLLQRFSLEKVVVGVHAVGRAILWNIFAYADSPAIITKKSLTFHLGDDNAGKKENNLALVCHNVAEIVKILRKLPLKRLARVLEYDKKALKLLYKPKVYSEIDENAPNIFLHSMFRTGSSFFWKLLTTQHSTTAYYEPLHESLMKISGDSMSMLNEGTAKFHPHLDSALFWDNYQSLLNPRGVGVKHYKSKFAYEEYTKNSDNRELKRYIDFLLQSDQPHRFVLQLNRSSLRLPWFKHAYANAWHIYLFRDFRNQFSSYLRSLEKTDGKGFLRTNLMIVDMNANYEPFRGIEQHVKLPKVTHRGKEPQELFGVYDQFMGTYSLSEHYFIYLWHWVSALIVATESGASMINVSALARDLCYKREVELEFLKRRIYVDFDDLIFEATDIRFETLSEFISIEDKILDIFRDKISQSFPDREIQKLSDLSLLPRESGNPIVGTRNQSRENFPDGLEISKAKALESKLLVAAEKQAGQYAIDLSAVWDLFNGKVSESYKMRDASEKWEVCVVATCESATGVHRHCYMKLDRKQEVFMPFDKPFPVAVCSGQSSKVVNLKLRGVGNNTADIGRISIRPIG